MIFGVILIVNVFNINTTKVDEVNYYILTLLLLICILGNVKVYNNIITLLIFMLSLLMFVRIYNVKTEEDKYLNTKILKFIILYIYISLLLNISKIVNVAGMGMLIFSFFTNYKLIEGNYVKNKNYMMINIIELFILALM